MKEKQELPGSGGANFPCRFVHFHRDPLERKNPKLLDNSWNLQMRPEKWSHRILLTGYFVTIELPSQSENCL